MYWQYSKAVKQSSNKSLPLFLLVFRTSTDLHSFQRHYLQRTFRHRKYNKEYTEKYPHGASIMLQRFILNSDEITGYYVLQIGHFDSFIVSYGTWNRLLVKRCWFSHTSQCVEYFEFDLRFHMPAGFAVVAQTMSGKSKFVFNIDSKL